MNTEKIQHNPLLRLENLSVRVRDKLVLTDIDWQIGVGEQWGILGPNGSGKTTLAKTLAGQLPAIGGNIRFYPPEEGDRVRTPKKNDIGFVSAEFHRRVFERYAFAEEIRHFTGDDKKALSVSDFILDRLENAGKPSPDHIKELESLSGHFGMRVLLNKRVGTLTTGEISKILILKSLLHHPQLLILDEPFKGLDRRSKQGVAEIIGNLMRTGLHLILITHCIEEIGPEISHVLVLTADGVQKMGRKNGVLQSHVLQQIYHIDHNPLHREPLSALQPSHPARRHLSKWRSINDMPEGTKLVEMIHVNVQYDRHAVLKNVHWTICKGENWMVHGSDGAGKTTLLKLITGENLQAYANNIFLFGKKKGSGESIWDIKQKIGWISSDLHSRYPANIKGADVVCSGFFDSVGLFCNATTTQRNQVEKWLSALGIDYLARENYGELSHGQKQMLLIARAIIKSPPLLLLDEPCEGLDFANRRKIGEIIEFIGRHTPSTVVYATVDKDDILPCIKHQLYLDGGRATNSGG